MQFRLRVHGSSGPGNTRQIAIDAKTESEAIRQAVRNGWRVLSIDNPTRVTEKRTLGRAKKFPVLQFSQELLALLEAGLNLNEAVNTLHAKESRLSVKNTLGDLLTSMQQGKSFSDALTAFPEIFPDIYIASVRAAERSGNLPEALARFVGYQLQFDAIKKKLTSAAIYPAMLVLLGGCVTLFLLGYVVPKFSMVYESAGRDIPFMSQMLLGAGKVIAKYGLLFLIGLAGLIVAIVYAFADQKIRQYVLETILRIPLLAKKAGEFRLARFYRALSLLLHAGIPLSKGLGMVSGMLILSQQEKLMQARRLVEEGQPFSAALEQHQLATPVAQSLLKVGENSGRLGDMLERSASFHDEEFARWIDWGSRLLEPILMTFIGIVIGAVVVLMYMPIFELAGSLS